VPNQYGGATIENLFHIIDVAGNVKRTFMSGILGISSSIESDDMGLLLDLTRHSKHSCRTVKGAMN
jgi:hypothetical protein